MKLTKLSIQKSTVPIVLFTILTLVGAFFYTKLRYELMPDISTPILTVVTVYPGASPSEVEQSVTVPVEDALATLEGIDEIISKSLEGASVVQLNMGHGADVDVALLNAQQKINGIKKDLPEDILEPSIDQFDINALPIMKIGATSDQNERELFDLIDQKIQPALSQTKGVAQVNVYGGSEREIQVKINRHKLESYNIPITQVQQIIAASNIEFPAGKIKNPSGQTTIRLAGKIQDINALEELIIKGSKDGSVVKLKDIATIEDATKEVEVLTHVNGQNAIGIEIQKQGDANAVEVSKTVREKMDEMTKRYAKENLSFKIADDQSEFTLDAANAVTHDLLFAIVLVSLVMLFFLQSLRNSIFVLVAIPTSLIATFTAMYLFGFTLDMISLMSLSLVVGSLVDDAIVVIENIYRHMEMGKNRIQASFDGIKELGLTVTSITLVLVAVFLPIAFVSGITGQILREYAVIIVVSMLLSLLVSFTLVPLMTSRFAKLGQVNDQKWLGRRILAFERFINRIGLSISKIMNWSLRHKFITLSSVIIMFVGSVALIPTGYIGMVFTDPGDRGNFIIQLELPKDATIEQTNLATIEAEKILGSRAEVSSIYTTIGRSSGGFSKSSTPYMSELNVTLVDSDQREYSSAIMSRILRVELEEILTGVKVKASNVNMMGNSDKPIKLFVTGEDFDSLMIYTNQVIATLESIGGTAEVESSVDEGNPEVQILIDREKMSKLGLNIAEVGMTIQTAFAGNTDNKFRDGDNEYDINVRFDQFNRNATSDIENMTFTSRNGQIIKLSQFADFQYGSGPSKLERYNRNKSTEVTCQLVGTTQGEVQSEFDEKLMKVQRPQGVQIEYSKATALMKESFADLMIAIIAAIIFVYLIMVVLYNNWVHPLVVLFSIPMAISGGLFALALAMQNLSIITMLGMIMLIGLVAKNAILVVDFTNDLKKQGKETVEALNEAVKLRFRPILMTNISMIIGLLPLALSTGAGAEWKTGLGWALIGGLTLSMFLSMIVVPVVYYIFDRIMAKMGLDKPKEIIIK